MSKTKILKIGNLIKKLRIKKDIDVKTLADKVNLSVNRIYDLERDRSSPSFDSVIKIIYDGLNASIPELFESVYNSPDPNLINSLISQLKSKDEVIDNMQNQNKELLNIIEKHFTKD